MKREELTKTFMMTSNWKKTFGFLVYIKKIQSFKDKRLICCFILPLFYLCFIFLIRSQLWNINVTFLCLITFLSLFILHAWHVFDDIWTNKGFKKNAKFKIAAIVHNIYWCLNIRTRWCTPSCRPYIRAYTLVYIHAHPCVHLRVHPCTRIGKSRLLISVSARYANYWSEIKQI